MIVPKVIMLAAALGAVSLLGSAPSSLAANEHESPVARCGDTAITDSNALQHPLPNAYMTANGRVFSLADLVACAKRLHISRFS